MPVIDELHRHFAKFLVSNSNSHLLFPSPSPKQLQRRRNQGLRQRVLERRSCTKCPATHPQAGIVYIRGSPVQVAIKADRACTEHHEIRLLYGTQNIGRRWVLHWYPLGILENTLEHFRRSSFSMKFMLMIKRWTNRITSGTSEFYLKADNNRIYMLVSELYEKLSSQESSSDESENNLVSFLWAL